MIQVVIQKKEKVSLFRFKCKKCGAGQVVTEYNRLSKCFNCGAFIPDVVMLHKYKFDRKLYFCAQRFPVSNYQKTISEI